MNIATPGAAPSLEDFNKRTVQLGDKTRDVYVSGSGPAVIVMTEMPGIYSEVLRFAGRIRDAGFRVYLPDLFGQAGREPGSAYLLRSLAGVCISREFRVLASNRGSPIVDWLRALARQAFEECGGKGVGAIGMCFTGNFALNLMLEPSVVAPVLAQPSLPLGRAGGLHIEPDDLQTIRERLENEDLTVRAYRFAGDGYCKQARFDEYRRALGARFEASVLPDDAARPDTGQPPHSVFTVHFVDEAGQPTRRALDEIVAFFAGRLRETA